MQALLPAGQSPAFILEAFFYAFIGGLLPALIWLWFWMHESHEHHEPRGTIWLTFVVGMCCVLLVYPFQLLTQALMGTSDNDWNNIVVWAALEETFKFGAAYFIALRLKGPKGVYDEPIDAFVYLMTAALGFAAMENTFYMLMPLLQGDTLSSILANNMRFMGADLLHVASSGVLSLFIAAAYYKPRIIGKLYALAGIMVAILLHSTFNKIILWVIDTGVKENVFIAFSFVWLTIIILILALERVKAIKKF